MKYSVRPKDLGTQGQFSVFATDEREALTIATRLIEHGCGVEIQGVDDGSAYDIAELERTLLERELV